MDVKVGDILAESSSRIQESAQEAWFTHDGLHDFAIFHWQFPSVTPAGCGPRESILQRVKLIRDCNFLDSCVYKFELSIVRSAYSAITDDPSNNFNVCFCWWNTTEVSLSFYPRFAFCGW